MKSTYVEVTRLISTQLGPEDGDGKPGTLAGTENAAIVMDD